MHYGTILLNDTQMSLGRYPSKLVENSWVFLVLFTVLSFFLFLICVLMNLMKRGCYVLKHIPPKFICWSLNSWCDCIWGQAFQQVMKVQWGLKGGSWSDEVVATWRQDTEPSPNTPSLYNCEKIKFCSSSPSLPQLYGILLWQPKQRWD